MFNTNYYITHRYVKRKEVVLCLGAKQVPFTLTQYILLVYLPLIRKIYVNSSHEIYVTLGVTISNVVDFIFSFLVVFSLLGTRLLSLSDTNHIVE